jgi:hypothetical protein
MDSRHNSALSTFFTKEWMKSLVEGKEITEYQGITIDGETIHVSVVRAAGQKKWVLYGSFSENGQEGLKQLFHQARQQGIFQVESNFNMARWENRDMLEEMVTITEPFGTYLIDLSLEKETLFSNLHRHHRRTVRYANREGLVVDFNLKIEELENLMALAYRKTGRDNPFKRSYFQALKRRFQKNYLLAGVISNQGVEAALLVPYDQQRGYYLHGGARMDGVRGAANLLHWEMILRLKEMGVLYYDLGGARASTDDPRLKGIFKFKERFGGKFVPCFYWQKVIHPGRKWFHDSYVKLFS